MNELPSVMLLTPLQASHALSISPRTLWTITSPRGDLPCVRIGRAVRYSVDDIQAFIERSKMGSVVDEMSPTTYDVPDEQETQAIDTR